MLLFPQLKLNFTVNWPFQKLNLCVKTVPWNNTLVRNPIPLKFWETWKKPPWKQDQHLDTSQIKARAMYLEGSTTAAKPQSRAWITKQFHISMGILLFWCLLFRGGPLKMRYSYSCYVTVRIQTYLQLPVMLMCSCSWRWEFLPLPLVSLHLWSIISVPANQ